MVTRANAVYAVLSGQEQCPECGDWFDWNRLRIFSRWCAACVAAAEEQGEEDGPIHQRYTKAYAAGRSPSR